MQELGIVDAVFTGDSDAFMFKGTTVLRFQVDEKKQKSKTHALMYRMSEMKAELVRMDWKALVLFAIMVGGDYAVKGLPGCGPAIALAAARQGFGASLVHAFKRKTLDPWRHQLQQFLRGRGSNVSVPAGFPNLVGPKNYIEPRVSSDEDLRSGIAWSLPVDQTTLRVLITERFNFDRGEYIRWVIPMLLVRKLMATDGRDELGVQAIRSVSHKDSGNIKMSKVSFLLRAMTDIHLLGTWPPKVLPGGAVQASRKAAHTFEERVECNIPDSTLKLATLDMTYGTVQTKAKRGRSRRDTTPSSGSGNVMKRPRCRGSTKEYALALKTGHVGKSGSSKPKLAEQQTCGLRQHTRNHELWDEGSLPDLDELLGAKAVGEELNAAKLVQYSFRRALVGQAGNEKTGERGDG